MNEKTAAQILQSEIKNPSTAFSIDYRVLAICEYNLVSAVLLKTLIESVPADYDDDTINILIDARAFPVSKKKLSKGMLRLHNAEIITINEIIGQDDEYGISFYIADFLSILENYDKENLRA